MVSRLMFSKSRYDGCLPLLRFGVRTYNTSFAYLYFMLFKYLCSLNIQMFSKYFERLKVYSIHCVGDDKDSYYYVLAKRPPNNTKYHVKI